jgi:acyl transferase domain-containing protein
VVLKRLEEARRDGDRILAVIRGSAVNQDGASATLTAPNPAAQEALLRAALAEAGVRPADVAYLEAHGTGTELGDPIEVQAAARVLGKDRPRERPLLLGAVKSNVGHLEAASGVAGLIKVVLSLQHRTIPGNLHFRTPNPHIRWDDLPVRVVDRNRPWPEGPRIAGVSSFGFSGTNAHVVLEVAPEPAPRPGDGPPRPGEQVLLLSTKTPQALHQLAGRYARWLEGHRDADLADVCFTAATGRSHFEHRAALAAGSAEQVVGMLRALESGQPGAGLLQGGAAGRPKVGWLFGGPGNVHGGMAWELYQGEPAFRKTLDRCAEVTDSGTGRPLTRLPLDPGRALEAPRERQLAMFAVQVALAGMWQEWGVEPDFLLGHGPGQYAAACVAGVFSIEEGLQLLARRADLLGQQPTHEILEALFAPREQVEESLRGRPSPALAAGDLPPPLPPTTAPTRSYAVPPPPWRRWVITSVRGDWRRSAWERRRPGSPQPWMTSRNSPAASVSAPRRSPWCAA